MGGSAFLTGPLYSVDDINNNNNVVGVSTFQ